MIAGYIAFRTNRYPVSVRFATLSSLQSSARRPPLSRADFKFVLPARWTRGNGPTAALPSLGSSSKRTLRSVRYTLDEERNLFLRCYKLPRSRRNPCRASRALLRQECSLRGISPRDRPPSPSFPRAPARPAGFAPADIHTMPRGAMLDRTYVGATARFFPLLRVLFLFAPFRGTRYQPIRLSSEFIPRELRVPGARHRTRPIVVVQSHADFAPDEAG